MRKLLTVFFIVLLASPIGAGCDFMYCVYSGKVLQHKKDSPYPFQSRCAFWQSKVIIEVVDNGVVERYKGYITPTTVCDGFNCNSLSRGDLISFSTYVKMKQGQETLRGNLVEVRRAP